MESKFEKFIGGPNVANQERLYVSLSKYNVISLSNATYERMGKPRAVYLHYSRSDETIAVEPAASARLPTAFPVMVRGRHGWRIAAAPFCQHFNIMLDATHRFVSPEIREGCLYLDLARTVTVRRRPRN
jgi:hypothetical protein